MNDEYLYVIEAPALELIKIGTSRNPAQRLIGIQTDVRKTHGPLNLLLIANGGRRHEAILHKWMAPFRVSGEWFRFTPTAIRRLWFWLENQPGVDLPPRCSFSGCPRNTHAANLCSTHYRRIQRHNDPGKTYKPWGKTREYTTTPPQEAKSE